MGLGGGGVGLLSWPEVPQVEEGRLGGTGQALGEAWGISQSCHFFRVNSVEMPRKENETNIT